MPNQVHNCTAWLIQYSYEVDYYFMQHTFSFDPPTQSTIRIYDIQYSYPCGYSELIDNVIMY